MTGQSKIKIDDNQELRNALLFVINKCDQVTVAKWAIHLSRHVFGLAKIDYRRIQPVVDGYRINEQWQNGKARMFDVRQAGFAIHAVARASEDSIEQASLRVAGQAVGTGHMKEHGMVASDYGLKVINLVFPGIGSEIERERSWQIERLQKLHEAVEAEASGKKYSWKVKFGNTRLHVEPSRSSQTIMYLSEGHLLREVSEDVDEAIGKNTNQACWLRVETKTGIQGFCRREQLENERAGV